jgi:RHS repeat-associated protein
VDVRRKRTNAIHDDYLSSLTGVSDPDGKLFQRLTYSPEGVPVSEIQDPKHHKKDIQPVRFASYEYEARAALYRAPTRFYDPSAGLFTTPDEADPDVNEPASLNPYAYAFHNPLRYTDVTGMYVDEDGNTFEGPPNPDPDAHQYVDHDAWSEGRAGVGGYSTPDHEYVYSNGHVFELPSASSQGLKTPVVDPIDLVLLLPGLGKALLARAGVSLTEEAAGRTGVLLTESAIKSMAEQAEKVSVELTGHALKQMTTRGITQEMVDTAVESAREAGNITSQIGKYGTEQLTYNGSNGVSVVVETQGRNAGKAITVWHTGTK